jgi:hypothetical protein
MTRQFLLAPETHASQRNKQKKKKVQTSCIMVQARVERAPPAKGDEVKEMPNHFLQACTIAPLNRYVRFNTGR